MPRPINLLPWRQARRQELLRFWGLMFGALALLAAVLYARQHAVRTQALAQAAVYARGDTALRQALAGQEARLKARLADRARLDERRMRLRQTAGWEQALTTLADRLPPRAWLTAVGWQEGTLTLGGLTERFTTLAELDAVLRALPDWQDVASGATRRDERGRWQFSYRLLRTQHDPASD